MKTTKFWLATIATLLCSLTANAHDFEVGGIYYTITSSADLTVKVTYRGNYSDSYSNEYSGAVTIPSTATYNSKTYSVTGIGNDAFSGCSSLTSITIPESVTSIGWSAFSGCSSLTSITLPESVTSIGNKAFYNCSSLTAITIPEGVTSIGIYAFYDCSSLTSITLPESVTSIGESVFYKCSSLTAITIPESVTSIGYCAFYDCSGLTSITIPEGVTSIGDYAFSDCSSLYSVTIGSGVLSIGSNAFSTPDKVIWLTNTPPTGYVNAKGSINYVANDQYTSLSNVKVYPYLSSMFEVGGVKYVPVSPSERTCHAIDCAYDSTATAINVGETALFKGVAMKVTEVMPYTFYGNDHIKEVSVSHLGNIGDYAFCDCDAIETVTLGDSIGSLGDKAFYQCSSLQEIVIPDHVKSVGAYCFSGCSAMTNVTLGRKVATINNYAFQNCSSLPEITLPQAVTKVGDYVFSGCSKLADVVIADRTTALALGSNGSSALFADCQLDSVYIGGKITYSTTSSKGYSPFYRNTSLRTVVITDREEQIYDNEFYGCTNLKSVTIGNGVKSIGDYAFSGCSSLDGFSFGSNMESIGAEAFSDCTNLTTITSHAAVPPTCGTQALDDINKWSCTLRVPQNYATAYQAADQWKEFFFIEDVVEVEQYILTYVVDGEVYHTDTLVHKATIVQPETPVKEGYTFSGWSEAPETMPAEDVTISGMFTVNIYKVYYYVGEELIYTAEVPYGEAIPEYIYEPTKEDEIFEGWIGETYATMPAHDVTYVANITNDVLQLIIDNSQLTIYDLMGRKVTDTENLKGGVYIINGRKVVIGD